MSSDLDGFSMPPIEEPKRPKIGKERPTEGKDYSLFTLDYAFRKVGGRKAAVELARLASARDPRLKALVEGYDALTKGQQKHKPKLLESLCIENSLDPSEFLGICTAIAHRFQLDASSMVAASHIEEIVEVGAQQAKTPEGYQDRKMFYEHSTFLPVKGPGVAVQINNGPQGQQGVALPEFRSLSEIALEAISRVALPPAPPEAEEKEEVIDGCVVPNEPASG